MVARHIVRAYDEALDALRQAAVDMGRAATRQFEGALASIERRDSGLGRKVAAADDELDNLKQLIDQSGFRILLLRQPMAADLREVVTALRIAADWERIGDHAANIAKRAIALNQGQDVGVTASILDLGHLVRASVAEVRDAYDENDLDKALTVWRRDYDIDMLYSKAFRDLLHCMSGPGTDVEPCAHLMFIAKDLERVGDHATNIAEAIHFLMKGEMIPGERPTADLTRLASPPAPEANGSGPS